MRDDVWKCEFCGSETDAPDRCPNCGAERKSAPQPASKASAVNANTFLLHQAHHDFVFGGSKSLNHTTRVGAGCLISFLSIFVVVGLVMLGMALWGTYEWYAINLSGVDGTGKLVDRRISSGDDSDNYFVSFQYAYNGKDYRREQQVSWDVYNRAEVGGSVSIVYVPSRPQTAKLAGTNSAPTAMLLFGFLWNGIVFSIIFFANRQYRRVKFLERCGRIIPGEVVQSTYASDSDGDLSVKVEYAFRVPESDRRLTRTEHAVRNDLKKTPRPAPGTPVAVLYYDDQRYMLL